MKKILFLIMLLTVSCGRNAGDFTAAEKALIHRTDAGIESMVPEGTMRVLTIADPADNEVLRAPSSYLSEKGLRSEDYAALCSLMVATVTHPSQDGVGIAGPQVGLNRRVVAVQRFDKEGEPFEVYPNISITWASDSKEAGPEGCLSVPDRREDVLRSTEIEIEYADPSAGYEMVREKVSGFTAVIFQHEIDHLDGVLYIDRL